MLFPSDFTSFLAVRLAGGGLVWYSCWCLFGDKNIWPQTNSLRSGEAPKTRITAFSKMQGRKWGNRIGILLLYLCHNLWTAPIPHPWPTHPLLIQDRRRQKRCRGKWWINSSNYWNIEHQSKIMITNCWENIGNPAANTDWHHKMFHLSISVTRQQCCQCRANSNLKQGKWGIEGGRQFQVVSQSPADQSWMMRSSPGYINWSDRSQSLF